MNKPKTSPKAWSGAQNSKKPAAGSGLKLSKDQKKKARQSAKFSNNTLSILCTNGKRITTKSSIGNHDQKSNLEIYSDPFMHVAWNPKKARNVIDKNSSFAKKFGDLSSF
jgi:hypothetical protein